MKILLSFITMITFFYISILFISEELYYKDDIVKIHAEQYGKNSISITTTTHINQTIDCDGVVAKENKDYITIGFVKCTMFQKCLVDIKYNNNGTIIIKNNNKPVKVRYRLKLKNGDISRLEQIWP